MSDEPEIRLASGNVSAVYRVGDTLRCTPGGMAAAGRPAFDYNAATSRE